MDRLITLGEALARPIASTDDDKALFLAMNGAWSVVTACAILVVDRYDEVETDPPFAIQNGLSRALSIPQVEDVIANAREQIAEPSAEQLLAALLHYYERDAFIQFSEIHRH